MTFESASMSLRPQALSLGAPVTDDEAGQLPGFANFIYQTRVDTHVNLTCAPQGWATAAPGTAWTIFRPTADGSVVFFRNRIRVQPEAENVVVGARVFCDTGDECTVTFTVGAASTSLNFTDSDNGTEKTDTLVVATPGWLDVFIEIEKTAGSGDSYLFCLRIADEQRTDFPTPVDE